MLDRTTEQGQRADGGLRGAEIVWLTTVHADGRPQSSPIWFLWDGETILFYTKPDQKVRNIRRGPKVSLHLSDNGHGGDIVSIEGAAAVVSEGTPATIEPAYLEKYRQGIAGIGMTPEQMAAEYHVTVRVTPTRFRIW
ncbi:MAG: TIGR03667 family PPOX class F420-dependent oxidoreductase [Dehalococcoidia bacterium]